MTNDHSLLVLLARIIAGNLRTAGAVRVCEPGRDMKVDGYGMSERIMKMVDDKPPDVHPRCISEGRIRKLIYCSQPGGELVVDGVALTPSELESVQAGLRARYCVEIVPAVNWPARHGGPRTTVLSPDERKEIWHWIEQKKLARERGVNEPGPVMNLEQAETLMRATER